jgi:hypothetical protein
MSCSPRWGCAAADGVQSSCYHSVHMYKDKDSHRVHSYKIYLEKKMGQVAVCDYRAAVKTMAIKFMSRE